MPETAQDVVVETLDLVKDYTDFWGIARNRAVDGVSLRVRRGEIFGLLGPNGSGKTTTLKILLGLLFPTSGTALVLGRDPLDVGTKERIGFLPEESYLYRFLNAEETLDFYGRLFRLPRAVRKQRINELLELVGLTHVRTRAVRQFSKGMARRVGFAQALINDPEVIFLDEPTSGLDPIVSRQFKDLILELKRRGKTVVMSSHLLADIEDVCDRIAILHEGKLRRLGTCQELLRIPDILQVNLKGYPEEAVTELSRFVEQKGGSVAAVTHPSQTLENLFLKTIGPAEPK